MARVSECHPERPHSGRGMCKPCYMRDWHIRNVRPDPVRREANRQRGAAWYARMKANPTDDYLRSQKNRALKKDCGITLDKYEEMLASQGGVCAICGNPETSLGQTGRVKALAVDHDHSCCPGSRACGSCTRALLCQSCNQMIGQAGDNPVTLRKAADYLVSHG